MAEQEMMADQPALTDALFSQDTNHQQTMDSPPSSPEEMDTGEGVCVVLIPIPLTAPYSTQHLLPHTPLVVDTTLT